MRQFTDEQVLNWVKSQEATFKATAQGCGFDAIQAQVKLQEIKKLTVEEKLRIGRLNLETIQKEGLYLNQLPIN